jgi:glycosyltransferase involved in cell wall biosynthesis
MMISRGDGLRIGVVYLGRKGPGGVIAYQIARQLPEGVERFAVVSRQAEIYNIWKESGLDLIAVDTFKSTRDVLFSYLNQRPVQELAARIHELKPDVLLFPMQHPWNWILQSILKEIPAVVMVHDPLPHPGLRDMLQTVQENLSIRRASRCIVLSQIFTPDLTRRGCPPDRVDVIPTGILNFSDHLDVSLRPYPGTKRLLFFGRIQPYKGLEILLPAFRQVLQAHGDAELWLVGEGNLNPYRRLIAGIPNLQIVNRWVGADEMDQFFSQAALVLLPYTSASQSGVIAVAAAQGVPIIATRVGGIPEQIRDGESGRLVKPGSVEELAQAVIDLLNDPAAAEQIGQKLAQIYHQQHSWDQIGQKVYASCLKGLSRRRGG